MQEEQQNDKEARLEEMLEIDLPEEWLDKIEHVGSLVTSTEPGKTYNIEDIERLSDVGNKRFKLRTFLVAWERQQNEERKIRRSFSTWIGIGLTAQMILVNLTFFMIGFQWLKVEQWVAASFILAVLTEITAIATIVVKYLFPTEGTDVLKIWEKL